MQHVGGRGEHHAGLWWGNLRERNHLEDLSIDCKIMLRWFFKQWGEAWNGFI